SGRWKNPDAVGLAIRTRTSGRVGYPSCKNSSGVLRHDGALKLGRTHPVNESQVFTDALKRATPAERAAYLNEVCVGDPRLRADVESLLQAHDSDPCFLEQPADSFGESVDASHAPGVSSKPSGKHGGAEQAGVVLDGRYKL